MVSAKGSFDGPPVIAGPTMQCSNLVWSDLVVLSQIQETALAEFKKKFVLVALA
jgi:hypothetical protein